jgi:hypothetical protein
MTAYWASAARFLLLVVEKKQHLGVIDGNVTGLWRLDDAISEEHILVKR